MRDSNPRPHGCDTCSTATPSIGISELASPVDAACTSACTSEGKTEHVNTLDALAAALLGLSPEDRAKLAAMLLAGKPEQRPSA